jgi:DNA-directed RNA polymerase subunit delta
LAIKDYTKEQISEMSNIDIAREILADNSKEMLFKDLLAELNAVRGTDLSGDALATFYADLNSDGTFISLGKQEWGMRSWYAAGAIDEATHDGFDDYEETSKKKSDEDVVGFDEIDEDEDVIDTDDEDEDVEENETTDDGDDDEDVDQEDVSLNDDNEQLDVLDANNDLDDLGDGDVE